MQKKTENKKEKALELYLAGKFSLEGATHFADMYIGDFLELMKVKGVEKNITMDDFVESLKNI